MQANITIKGLSIHVVNPVEGSDKESQFNLKADEISVSLKEATVDSIGDTFKLIIQEQIKEAKKAKFQELKKMPSPSNKEESFDPFQKPELSSYVNVFGGNIDDMPKEIFDQLPDHVKDLYHLFRKK
ncbi:hypothetical protein TCA2_4471 [Paenibacillus sp. TCA20]|uniref:hypothetical protein n=1 Tax=Paenibacillus sp. TCA20 TaxID=1499968 RepID=UPI0004D5EB16|nr:hypothetical protein [Paenibacillus sp. TCA20]GAK41979.1 hypothetical protein TCA2_4471 [Paenibacillus sp. TCA20]